MIKLERFHKLMSPFLKDDSVEFCQELMDQFVKSTRQHIIRVNTVASFIGKYYPYHDLSKFDSPFYYLLPYRHGEKKLEDIVKPDRLDELNERLGKATWKHILTDSHHPEFWDKNLSLNTPFDRDNPKCDIDATQMSESALDEYTCDCLSMSIQIDNDPKAVHKWFDDNISTRTGSRWIMSAKQIKYINELADKIIKILQNPDRKVFFDVDGVLRDIVGYFGTSDDSWDVKVDGKTICEKITEDFSVLADMPPMDFVKVVKDFTHTPFIMSSQQEPEAQKFTNLWLKKYFGAASGVYVTEGSYRTKDSLLKENDRIFDDHPKFPESNKLIIVSHGYNEHKQGLRVNTPFEMEAVLEVLKKW